MLSGERSREIRQWLRTKLSLEEARAHFEAWERDTMTLMGSAGGWISRFEKRIVANFQPGDEVWLYDSGQESWAAVHGEKGMALVRNGVVVAVIVESSN
jgi:hypothetical protein